jgi:hypothetical protein
MRSRQREGRIAVIECGVLPAGGVMASGTYRAELAAVSVIGRVTGYTFRRRAFENPVDVAGPALNARVCTS